MQSHVLLFRGINVGGKNILPMKELKTLLTELGYHQVQSYIQSGNILLQAEQLELKTIQQAIHDSFGFSPKILSLTKEQLIQSIANNPYPNGAGNQVHFYYCQQTPDFDEAKAQSLKTTDEEYQLIDQVLYLHAPSGIGRSKLAAKLESCLRVSASARNLNTVLKLQTMSCIN